MALVANERIHGFDMWGSDKGDAVIKTFLEIVQPANSSTEAEMDRGDANSSTEAGDAPTEF